MNKNLTSYRKKRDFKKTKEPKGITTKVSKKNIFVIQKHAARSLHFDFRIKMGRTLKSWAVPKGISKSTKDKRLAVLTEDHPLEYAKFSGKIPKGEYGGGKIEIWDKGHFENIKKDKTGKIIPLKKCFQIGHIELYLHGTKIKGAYALVHFKEKNWLLIKMKKRKDD